MQNSLYKDIFYEKNQAANYTSSSSQFFFSWKIFYFFKDLLRNNRKKNLLVQSLSFLVILVQLIQLQSFSQQLKL